MSGSDWERGPNANSEAPPNSSADSRRRGTTERTALRVQSDNWGRKSVDQDISEIESNFSDDPYDSTNRRQVQKSPTLQSADTYQRARLSSGRQHSNKASKQRNYGATGVGEPEISRRQHTPSGGSPFNVHLPQPGFLDDCLRMCIYASLCWLPDRREANFCKFRTFISVIIHVTIFAVGITLLVLSVIALGGFDKSPSLKTAKVLSALVGVLFIFVFVFWCFILFLTHVNDCHNSPCISFTFSVTWAVMFLFSTCITVFFIKEIIVQGEQPYLARNCTGEDGKTELCFNFVVVWGLAAIIIYKLFYSVVIFITVIRKSAPFCSRIVHYDH